MVIIHIKTSLEKKILNKNSNIQCNECFFTFVLSRLNKNSFAKTCHRIQLSELQNEHLHCKLSVMIDISMELPFRHQTITPYPMILFLQNHRNTLYYYFISMRKTSLIVKLYLSNPFSKYITDSIVQLHGENFILDL